MSGAQAITQTAGSAKQRSQYTVTKTYTSSYAPGSAKRQRGRDDEPGPSDEPYILLYEAVCKQGTTRNKRGTMKNGK